MATKRIGNITINYTVPAQQTQLYNALGRTTGISAAQNVQQNNQGGSDNFFAKRGRSIENALGTTGASIVAGVNDRIENAKTDQMRKDNKKSMNDIAKKYGYNSWSDWQDANAAARESGDKEAIKQFDKQLKEFQAQANANANKATEKAKSYNDYRQNDYISQKVNQDRGKFAGSAINTLSTAVDVTGLGANPLSNAVQGGIEGLADELEQNGFQDFSWERAGQNALIGATTGAVTGAVNAGVSGALAKRAAAKGLTNTAVKSGVGSAIKNGAKTIATGAARGALSGAVGGATGAGLQSALNGVEFGQGVQNALQGAVQGAKQGAVTGATMAGANMAISKTPGVGKFYNELQNAKTNWDQSGSNFDERLTNTLTSGDSAVGDWLMNKRQSNVLGAAGNLGNRVQDVSGAIPTRTPEDANDIEIAYNEGALTPKELVDAYNRGEISETALTRSWDRSNDTARKVINDALSSSEKWNASRQNPTTAKGTVRLYRGLEQEYDPNYPSSKLDTNGYESWTDSPELAKQYGKNVYYIDVPESDIQNSYLDENPNSPTYGDRYPLYKTTKAAGLNGISGNEYQLEVGSDYQKGLTYTPLERTDTPTTAKGWAKKAGQRIVEDVNNSNLGNRVKDVSSDMPEDIRNMQIRDYNVDADGQNSSRPYEYIGANGKKALKIEMPILNDVPAEESSAFIKQAVMDLAQEGRLLNVGDIPEMADISRNSSRKLGGNAGWSDTQLRQRNEVIADINEVGDYLHNVRYEAPKAGSRDNVAGVIKGDVEIDINGEKIYPEVVYRLYDNGDLVLHDVTKINRLPSGNSSDRNLGRQYRLSEATKQPSDTSIVTQNNKNVNVTDPWDRVAQEAGYSNYDEVLQRYAEANPNAKINPRGMAGQVLTWMDQNPNTPTTAAGWAKRAGQRAVEGINNSNLGLKVQDVSQDDPSKQLYNALAGNRQPVAETELEADTDMGVVPSKTSKEGKLRYARGKELLRQYGTVDQPMARASRAVESVQEIADAGFTKPEDVERMANVITGSNGEVSKLTRNLIKNADPVDTFAGENGQTMEDFIDKRIRLNSLGGRNAGEAVKQTIDANLQSLPSRAEGSVTYADAPEDVFKVVQNLEASAAELEGRGGSRYTRPSIENIHQAAVLKDTASLLKQRLFDGTDVKQALTPEVAQNLKSYDPNNKKYADWVDNTIMKAESINDLRAAQAPFVRMSKYIDNAYTQAATVGGRVAENASDLSRILTTRNGLLKAGIDAVWNSNTARRGRAAVYDKLADKAADKAANTPDTAAGWAKQAGQRAAEDLGKTNLGNRIQDVSGQPVNPQVATPAELADMTANYNPSTQLYNAIGRTEGLTNAEQANTAKYLVDAAQEAEIVPSMEMPVSGQTATIAESPTYGSTQLYNTVTGTPNATTQTASTGTTGYFEPTGDYWTDVLARAVSSAIDANDVDAFVSLYGMYQDAIAQTAKQSSSEKDYTNPTNWSSSDRSKLLTAQNGLDQIDQLEQAYQDATGEGGSNAIQGWLRSRASDISGGNWDPSASNYNALTDSVGLAIIKNLINLGVTTEDAERYKKYIPAITDTKEQAAEKLATLRSIYQNQINNLYSVYGV